MVAQSSNTPAWNRGIYIEPSPVPVLLSVATTHDTARHLARRQAEGRVLRGAGESTSPLYKPGTLMVIHPVRYEEPQRGQAVVYRNQARQLVAHVLVAKTRDGWRVTGLNNARPDRGGVRGDNLVGVVVAAIQPTANTPLAVR